MATDNGPGGTGTRAKNAPSTSDPAPDAPDTLAAPKAEASQATGVKYTGGAGVREITKAQWKKAGVEDQETTIWDASNEYTLPADKFSAEALGVLERDPQIKIK